MHHSTMAALVRLCRDRGLTLLTADDDKVSLDDGTSLLEAARIGDRWAPLNTPRAPKAYKTPQDAIRSLLRDAR